MDLHTYFACLSAEDVQCRSVNDMQWDRANVKSAGLHASQLILLMIALPSAAHSGASAIAAAAAAGQEEGPAAADRASARPQPGKLLVALHRSQNEDRCDVTRHVVLRLSHDARLRLSMYQCSDDFVKSLSHVCAGASASEYLLSSFLHVGMPTKSAFPVDRR